MATISAFASFNMLKFSFHLATTGAPEFSFHDDEPRDVAGVTYADSLRIDWGNGTQFLDVGGSDLVFDAGTGTLTAGTVTGIAGGTYAQSEEHYAYEVHGLAVSATALQGAISSPSTADDFNLIAAMVSGSDQFNLSAGDDVALGFAGQDGMNGFGGNDQLWGGGGQDLLGGAKGNDILVGGAGRDTLSGGWGADTFAFLSPDDGGDRITDFHDRPGDDDFIAIDKEGFGLDLDGLRLRASRFQTSETKYAEDGDVRFIFCTTNEKLWFDRNGSKAGGLTLIADLQDNADLKHHDILLV